MLNRLEFQYVPKHASWLNMVEIEIGVLRAQCLARRSYSKQPLVSEVAAWERQGNTSRIRIAWMFTTQQARDKWGAPTGNSRAKSQNHCDEVLVI